MGTKIIETGSTAGGTAKVEYKDEAGNVLWYYDDAGNFVRNGNIKINGNLSGTNNIAIQGTAYSNLENNVKIVQGVPAGGKMYLGVGTQTGAIKIKLPKAKSNAMFKFRVKMNGQLENKISSSEYIVKGYNSSAGMGITNANVNATHQVTVIKDNPSTMNPIFYFCTGATEDYILIGEITDTHNFKSVVIDNIETHHSGISDDWSKDWGISLVTTLETLTSQYKVAVTPSLNATHLNGVQETTTGEANKLVKVNSSGRIVLGGTDDGANKLQVTGSTKITGLAGTGSRMVVADSAGNLSANDCCLNLATGNNVPIKVIKNISLANNTFLDLFNFYSSGGFSSANYIGGVTGELKIKVMGLNSTYLMVDSYRTFLISANQQANGVINITNITQKDTFDAGVTPTITVRAKTWNTNVSAKLEISATFANFLECSVIAEIECLSTSNLSNNLIKIN